MSSEAEALQRLVAAFANLDGLALSRYDGVVDDLAKARAEKDAALDAYKTAIERRVLAQQPCYCAEALATETRCAFHGSLCPCVTCKARQTQETSG